MTRQTAIASADGGDIAWTLRIGASMCFVGHGAFGVMTKAAWVPYFAVAGIGADTAYALMPLVGAFDILMGCLMLWRPRPLIAYWMLAWAIWTALLRPLAGEAFWEALERAGNYGAPAAILLFMPHVPFGRSFQPATYRPLTPQLLARARRLLTGIVAALLVGHAILGVMGKTGLVHNYASVVSPARAVLLTPWVGWIEVGLAIAVCLWQTPRLLYGIAAWKIATELLFVTAGASAWEFVERGGSYAAPIALASVLTLLQRQRRGAAA